MRRVDGRFVVGLVARGLGIGGVVGAMLAASYGALAGVMLAEKWGFFVPDLGAEIGFFIGGMTGGVIGVVATGVGALMLVLDKRRSPRRVMRTAGIGTATGGTGAVLGFMFPPQNIVEALVLTAVPLLIAGGAGWILGDILGRWSSGRLEQT